MWCAHTLLPYANYRAGSSTVVQSSDIHDTDHTKRDALQKAIAYTAKVDTAVRLSLLQHVNTGAVNAFYKQGKNEGGQDITYCCERSDL